MALSLVGLIPPTRPLLMPPVIQTLFMLAAVLKAMPIPKVFSKALMAAKAGPALTTV